MTKSIPLNGIVNHKKVVVDYALVDDEDFEYLNQFNWCRTNYGYARRSFRDQDRIVYVSMHREILHAVGENVVDHVDGNRLNNQKRNIRICTIQQNTWNNKPNKIKKHSSAKGVTFCVHHKKWKSGIYEKGKYRLIGYYDVESDAIFARRELAKEIHGDFFNG